MGRRPPKSKSGGNDGQDDIEGLRDHLRFLQDVPHLQPDALVALERQNKRRKRAGGTKLGLVALAACLLGWAVASRARGPQQQVEAVAFVDELRIEYPGVEVLHESWESEPIGRPTSAPATRAAQEPFVTNARAAHGRRSLLVDARPRQNPKRLFALAPAENARWVRYQFDISLSDVGVGGVIAGFVEDLGPSPAADRGAIVFSHGKCKLWPSGEVFAVYEPKRWYHFEVEIQAGRPGTMSVSLDDSLVVRSVPLEFDPVRMGETFGVGGFYDGSALEQTLEPLTMVTYDDSTWTCELAGTTSGWRPSRIFLRPDDVVRIESDPEQTIRYAGSTAPARSNPDGYLLQLSTRDRDRRLAPIRYRVPAPGAWFGSLVARVGVGEGFLVGSRVEFTNPDEGELSLAYNDCDCTDNSGAFLVRVTVLRRRPAAGLP